MWCLVVILFFVALSMFGLFIFKLTFLWLSGGAIVSLSQIHTSFCPFTLLSYLFVLTFWYIVSFVPVSPLSLLQRVKRGISKFTKRTAKAVKPKPKPTFKYQPTTKKSPKSLPPKKKYGYQATAPVRQPIRRVKGQNKVYLWWHGDLFTSLIFFWKKRSPMSILCFELNGR